MKAINHDDQVVYLYQSMLYSRSSLLKEIYANSHRFEPWAVSGDAQPYGAMRFANVIYIPQVERQALFENLNESLNNNPYYLDALQQRLLSEVHTLLPLVRHGRLQIATPATLATVVDTTSRILSVGIFKEAFEPDQALAFLANFMPMAARRAELLPLYQPLCLPHFLAFEQKLLFFAERYLQRPTPQLVRACIAQCAYLSQFRLEATELEAPAAMRALLRNTIDQAGGSAETLRRRRRSLLREHQQAVARSYAAGDRLFAAMHEHGAYSLRARLLVRQALRFIQFIATMEELKHTLALRAARALRAYMTAHDLDIDTTDRKALLAAVTVATRGR